MFMYIMYMFRNVFDFMVFNSACFIDKFIENPNIFLTDHSKRFFLPLYNSFSFKFTNIAGIPRRIK